MNWTGGRVLIPSPRSREPAAYTSFFKALRSLKQPYFIWSKSPYSLVGFLTRKKKLYSRWSPKGLAAGTYASLCCAAYQRLARTPRDCLKSIVTAVQTHALISAIFTRLKPCGASQRPSLVSLGGERSREISTSAILRTTLPTKLAKGLFVSSRFSFVNCSVSLKFRKNCDHNFLVIFKKLHMYTFFAEIKSEFQKV